MTGSLRWPVALVCWVVVMFLLLPTLVVIPVSLTPHPYISLPSDGVSLQHYRALVSDPSWGGAALTSLVVATAAAVIAVALGAVAAVGLWLQSSRLGEAVRLFLIAPMIVPAVVTALAFYRLLAWAGLLDSFTGVTLAHAVMATPYVLISVSASLAGLDRRQEQAARSLGASNLQSLWRVILPQVRPGMAAGAIFAFLLSWDEIIVTLFVASRTVYTLPRKIWDGINEQIDPSIAAVATLLLIFTVILQVLLHWRQGTKSDGPS